MDPMAGKIIEDEKLKDLKKWNESLLKITQIRTLFFSGNKKEERRKIRCGCSTQPESDGYRISHRRGVHYLTIMSPKAVYNIF